MPNIAVPLAVAKTIKDVDKALIPPINFTPYISAHVEDPKTFAKPFVIPTKAKNTKDENSLLNLARMTADKKSGIFIKINNLLLLNLSIKKPATVKVITDITE